MGDGICDCLAAWLVVSGFFTETFHQMDAEVIKISPLVSPLCSLLSTCFRLYLFYTCKVDNNLTVSYVDAISGRDRRVISQILFEKYDQDKDGCLDPEEIIQLFSTCPYIPWGKQVRK